MNKYIYCRRTFVKVLRIIIYNFQMSYANLRGLHAAAMAARVTRNNEMNHL